MIRGRRAWIPLAVAAAAVLAPTLAWADAAVNDVSINIDKLWVLFCAALVIFMQAGFLCFEIGAVQEKNVVATAMKNIGDWAMLTIAFFLVSAGIMFGHSSTGFFGTDLIPFEHLEGGHDLGWVFFVFQLAFAATAATIVSGAMAERTGFFAYLMATLGLGAVIYPVFGHWVWGNAYFGDNEPWLASMGFIDFAGSSVVHMVGAIVAAVGIMVVGPRIGRFDDETGEVQPLEQSGLAWSALGTIILWFGWIGFNGGSTLALDESVGPIILNTNLAAAAGCLGAFAHGALTKGKDLDAKFLGGALAGLVAITACAHIVSPMASIFIGLTAGIIHNLAFDLVLNTWKLDDPVGAIPVHGFGGAWGILCVALFGNAEAFGDNSFWTQLGVQALGIVACLAWTGGTAYVMFKAVKATIGLRVSPEMEIAGIDISGRIPAAAYAGDDGGVDDDMRAMLEAMMAEEEE